jgi:hypothetical protein
MVAPHTRQATASEAVGVDLSVDSPGWHRMVADAQAESSANVCVTVLLGRSSFGIIHAPVLRWLGIEAALDISPLAGKCGGK